jgi:hypothetical protein
LFACGWWRVLWGEPGRIRSPVFSIELLEKVPRLRVAGGDDAQRAVDRLLIQAENSLSADGPQHVWRRL